MKLVKEHINEKFEEESDPLEDMGIGAEGIIQKFKDEEGWNAYDIFRYEIQTEKNIETAKMVMNYLLKKKEVDIDNKFIAEDLIRGVSNEELKEFIIDKAIEYKAKAALDVFLIETSKWNNTKLVTKLIKGGADPRIRGNKPMMLAIRYRNKDLWDLMEPYIKWKK